MIIDKIYIKSFGLFKDFTFVPKPGMNMIYAPNESGKTTLLDFLKYMFYGAGQRKKTDGLTFKEKYMPWDGLEICGSIEFTHGTKKYKLTRSDGNKSSEKKCILFDISAGRQCVIDDEPGKMFFGISEKAFCESCFITDVYSASSGESDNELMSIISGAQTDNIPYLKIRKSISEFHLSLSSPKRESSQINMLNKKIKQIETEISNLETEQNTLRKQYESVDELAAGISACQKKKNDLLSQCKSKAVSYLEKSITREQRTIDSISNGKTIGNDFAEFATESEKRIMNTDLSSYHFMSQNLRLILVVLSIILCLSAVYGLFYSFQNLLYIIISGCVIALFFTGVKLWLHKKEYRKKYSEQKMVFDKFDVKSYNEYIERYINICSAGIKTADDAQRLELCKKSIAIAEAQISRINKIENFEELQAENFVETNSFTNEEINDIIAETDAHLKQLKIRYERALDISERLDVLGIQVASALEQHSFLTNKRNCLSEQIKTYEYALDILDCAFEEMKNNVAPSVFENAHKLFSKTVGNKYTAIISDKNFSSSVLVDEVFRNSAYLSSGTRDILNFAIRMSVIEVLSAHNEPVPVFMDDPFSAVDDKRCSIMLDGVYELSKTHQCVYVTCLGREGSYGNNKNDVNTVLL